MNSVPEIATSDLERVASELRTRDRFLLTAHEGPDGDALGSLVIAFIVTVPVNRWMISRGKGHAVVHEFHHGHH